MSQTRLKINSQLEKSLISESVPVTNSINEQIYQSPVNANEVLGFDGLTTEFRDANTYLDFATQSEVDNGIVFDKPISTDTLAGTVLPSVIVGHDIATISNKTIRETITSLTDNGNGTFTHVSENGTSTTIDFDNDSTTVSDTNTVNLTLTGSDITADVNISTTVGNDITSDTTGIFVDVQAQETTTTITNTVVGNKIADYTDEDGVVTPINETITSLSQDLISGDIQFTKEDGSTDTAKVVSSDAFNNIEVGTDGGAYVTVPATTNTITWTQSTGVVSSNVSGVVSNTTINDATATLRGIVNTGAQTFGGDKTFTGNVSVEGNTTIGNATTDRLTVTSQILGATPLVFQGATDNALTQSISFVDPTANNTSTFRNVSGEVAHVFHDGAKSVIVGLNTLSHNLNLTNPNAVIVQAFDTATNQQVVLNMSAATANSFQFTSTFAGIIRVTCIG